jgi:D-serine deaminase-like pyridoxal phosphate-dependent protein
MQPMRIAELDTPSLVVDLDVFEANVRTGFARLAEVRVRPHLKTAKSPEVAALLRAAGAQGVCVAKLGEAEVMLEAGIDDVLVTTEIVGAVKVRRLAALRERHPRASLRTVIDSPAAARALDAAVDSTPPLEVLIDINVGQNRCGVDPADAVALADRVAELHALRIVGVQGYEGHLQHVRDATERRTLCHEAMQRLGAAVTALRAAGHRIDTVTTGGTGTAEFCAEHPEVTEVQPGSFAFMDADYLACDGVPYESALTVLATVISRPAADRVVVDAGLKTVSDDSGPARVADAPGWVYAHAGDEHGVLTRAPGDATSRDLQPGDRVALMPSHIDTTINLHDRLIAHRAGEVEVTWAVSARGRVQ